MSQINAADVVGRQLKLKQDVTGFLNYPGSNNILVWEKGFITPPVFSWLESNGTLYWVFWSEIINDPVYYFPHKPGYYELLPGINPTIDPSINQPGFYESIGLVDFAKFTPVAKTVLFSVGALVLYSLIKNATK